jgi:hypothetical protein
MGTKPGWSFSRTLEIGPHRHVLTSAAQGATGPAQLALVPDSSLTLPFQLVPDVSRHVTIGRPTVYQEGKARN